jgi:hypothetical protein
MSFDRREFRSKLCEIPLPVEEITCLAEFFTAGMEAEITALQLERDALKGALEAQHADAVKLRLRLIELGERINITAPASGEPARKP